MLKFISGALVGGAKYSDIYMTSNDEDDDISRTSENKKNTTEDHSNCHNKKVPTLQNRGEKCKAWEHTTGWKTIHSIWNDCLYFPSWSSNGWAWFKYNLVCMSTTKSRANHQKTQQIL